MTLHKKILYISTLALFCGVYPAYGQTPSQTARYFNGPTVSDISSTTAIFSLSRSMLEELALQNADYSNQGYFEYYKTQQVCPAIYPTPEYCLPKKTTKGVTSARIENLLPDTTYSVVYKKDNTVNCITTPCPSNSFTSLTAEFTTPTNETGSTTKDTINKSLTFKKNFGYRARGIDVTKLQTLLIQRGFMSGTATGYFGVQTLMAVKNLQKNYGITPTGFLGPLTRNILGYKNMTSAVGERFEGIITAVSTGCFSDGECSITVDGKKVVTTIGWSQEIVGIIFGSVNSVGDAELKIGTQAKVFAQKTAEGYTLYGNKDFYIEVK